MIDLSPGTVAYVDAEWLAVEASLPALTVDEKRVVRYGAREHQAAAGSDPDLAALQAFAALASDAADLIAERDPERVEVTGAGILALLVRAALGGERVEETPTAIVETTGDPETIVAALARLRSGGQLVLAGEPGGRRLDIDLYPHVHVRGLSVIGACPLLSRGLAAPPREFEVPQPHDAAPAGPLTPGAAWYRVAA